MPRMVLAMTPCAIFVLRSSVRFHSSQLVSPVGDAFTIAATSCANSACVRSGRAVGMSGPRGQSSRTYRRVRSRGRTTIRTQSSLPISGGTTSSAHQRNGRTWSATSTETTPPNNVPKRPVRRASRRSVSPTDRGARRAVERPPQPPPHLGAPHPPRPCSRLQREHHLLAGVQLSGDLLDQPSGPAHAVTLAPKARNAASHQERPQEESGLTGVSADAGWFLSRTKRRF